MKKTAIIFILSLLPLIIKAENSIPRITFGAEWSYMATLFSRYHYNYFTPEGYRFNVNGSDLRVYNNGEVLLHLGYNINEYWNISAYAGMSGIAHHHNSIPVNIRATRYFGRNAMNDRWFSFIDIGSGLALKKPMQGIFSAKAGGGYRISLSRNTKLDFLAALRSTYTQPQIYHGNEIIKQEDTNRSDVFLLSLSLGMALTF